MKSLYEASVEIMRKRGAISLMYSAKRRLFLMSKYKMKYGDLAPQPNEQMYISPMNIDYSLADKYIPEDAPPYGIIGGRWDLQKVPWRESIWNGLRERFEKGADWEDTVYYQHGVDLLSQGIPVKHADRNHPDGARSLEEFEDYLDYLDQLYYDIENNGYRKSSVITVSIGRNGEWMTNHGNHRRTIAVLADIESVPVKIRYRHTKWQKLRQRFYQANSEEELNEAEKGYLSHPDLQGLSPIIHD